MRNVKIITDSCADLTAEQLARYDIDYAKMSTVYNGIESPALLTWSEDEVHALYNIMRDGNRITTAQVSVEEFQRIFEKYLKRPVSLSERAISENIAERVHGHTLALELIAKQAANST